KKYKTYNSDCPYTFDYPVYASIESDNLVNSEPCWINIDFPKYNGKVHISYKTVDNNINLLLEDAYTLAYKHTVKADAIEEYLINKPDSKVYGILYDIEGNAASSVQFFLTDSTENFLRGALYFRTTIDKDSLAPVIDFFRDDILYFIDSFEWK
ncbi:MAG: gliding motility lipoprotein GldD, partial [Bacteroidetes bacterium]